MKVGNKVVTDNFSEHIGTAVDLFVGVAERTTQAFIGAGGADGFYWDDVESESIQLSPAGIEPPHQPLVVPLGQMMVFTLESQTSDGTLPDRMNLL